MKLFIYRSDGAYASFEGMTQDAIIAMLAAQGLTCVFIDEATFTANTSRQLGR